MGHLIRRGLLLLLLGTVVFLNSFNHSRTAALFDPIVAFDKNKDKRHAVHFLYGLLGNATGFLDEFTVSLKSLMLNAPLSASLTVHVMADQGAYSAIPDILNLTGIGDWKTRHPIILQIYNVENYLASWQRFIVDKMRLQNPNHKFVHTLGTFFRLFAQDVLDKTIHHVVYLDTDVAIMSHVDALWNQVDDNMAFQWGSMNAGFMILNIRELNQVWEIASSIDLHNLSQATGQQINDQLIALAVETYFPERVGSLPPEWDVGVTELWRGHLLDHRKHVGMLHLNGGGTSLENVFANTGDFFQRNVSRNTWGLTDYYNRMPWSWAQFIAESHREVGQQGHSVLIQFHPATARREAAESKHH